MPTTINTLLEKYTNDIRNIYGSNLIAVILYGSYARGDFTSNSDIDIMILVDLTEMEIKNYRHHISKITFEYNMENDLAIKPITKSVDLFQKWLNVYPFYQNVRNEGVALYNAVG